MKIYEKTKFLTNFLFLYTSANIVPFVFSHDFH